MAVSPDGRYVVTVNAGYGTFESKYEQSLAVMDTRTGKVMDFPDERTATTGKQTLYSGLAFSGDGKHLYASMASLTDPTGSDEGGCGEWDCGVWVRCREDYAGEIDPDWVAEAGGGAEDEADWRGGWGDGSAVSGGDCGDTTHSGDMTAMNGAPGLVAGERLLVADNLSDDALMIDARREGVDAVRSIGERCGAERRIRWRWRYRRMGREDLWRCGMRARWWNSI